MQYFWQYIRKVVMRFFLLSIAIFVLYNYNTGGCYILAEALLEPCNIAFVSQMQYKQHKTDYYRLNRCIQWYVWNFIDT